MAADDVGTGNGSTRGAPGAGSLGVDAGAPSRLRDASGRRVAVIGDVAGHLDELDGELRRLGADPESGRLPDDLTVIQVGDLVHRGPVSDAVVGRVDDYLTRQPAQWVQLVGNHEAQYLDTPAFHWPERIGAEAAATLRRWWADGQMRVAASVLTPSEDFLVTHAGLTAGFWSQVLDSPEYVQQAEAALNSLIGSHDPVLFLPGQMLTGKRPDHRAGPVWAAAASELVPSWLGTRMPFSQLHGHTSVFDWKHRVYRAVDEIIGLTSLDEDAKHESVALMAGRIIGVDPGHGRLPRRPWRAWETQV